MRRPFEPLIPDYVADEPFTVENPKAVIQAIGCIDKNEDPYPTR